MAGRWSRIFGEEVLDVIEGEPDRLREIDGIGPVRARRITLAWAEQKIVREIMVSLHSHEVGTARAVRIYKTYGADAVQVMTDNPYRLARDIRGIGFKTADAIAAQLGIKKTATIRIRAGISYGLTEATGTAIAACPSKSWCHSPPSCWRPRRPFHVGDPRRQHVRWKLVPLVGAPRLQCGDIEVGCSSSYHALALHCRAHCPKGSADQRT
jgi:hypothetical protein